MGVGRLRRTNKRYLAVRTCRARACGVGPGARACSAPLREEVSGGGSSGVPLGCSSAPTSSSFYVPLKHVSWRSAQLHPTPLVKVVGSNEIEKSILTVSTCRRGKDVSNALDYALYCILLCCYLMFAAQT